MSAMLGGALLFLAAAMPVPPSSVALEYEVLLGGTRIATVSEQFELRGKAYQLTSATRAVGLLALIQRNPLQLVSNGTVTASGLRPDRFEGARGPADPRRVIADFDWAASRLTLTRDGRADGLALPAGTQDRLSIMYQFMFLDLKQRLHIEFPMTNGRKLDTYRYAVTRDVPLETALGRIVTVHLVKQRDPGDTATELWLAPQFRNLPVKVLIVEKDGSRFEQLVTKLDVKP